MATPTMRRILALALLLTGCAGSPTTIPLEAGESYTPLPSGARAYRAPVADPAQVTCLQEITGSGTAGAGAQRIRFSLSAIAVEGPVAGPLGTFRATVVDTGAAIEGTFDEVVTSLNGVTLSGTLSRPAGATITVALPAHSAQAPPNRVIVAVVDGETVTAYGGLEPIEGALDFGLCGSGL